MVRYTYKARNLNGRIHRGKVEVSTDAEFYKILDEKGLYCISVSSTNQSQTEKKNEFRRMNVKELSIFCREFSVLLSSGMNLMTALQLLYERADKPKLKSCYMRMIEGIEKGDTLYEAMGKQGHTFPSLFRAMVLAGESSGSIDLIMEKMAFYYEREANMKAKVQNAMIYPIILILVTVGVIAVLFTFVLPQFFEMFQGQDVPGITSFFMGISLFMTNYWYIAILGLILFILLLKAACTSEKVAYLLDKWKLKLPVFGKLFEKIIMAHFANAMNILYASGITVVKALEISSGTVTNRYVSDKLILVREDVEKGITLSAAIQAEGLFERIFWSMVHIGEESGNLETMFLKLSEYLEQESESAVQKMMAVLEPTVLIFIAIVIGAVVASVLLPIYSMYQA